MDQIQNVKVKEHFGVNDKNDFSELMQMDFEAGLQKAMYELLSVYEKKRSLGTESAFEKIYKMFVRRDFIKHKLASAS